MIIKMGERMFSRNKMKGARTRLGDETDDFIDYSGKDEF